MQCTLYVSQKSICSTSVRRFESLLKGSNMLGDMALIRSVTPLRMYHYHEERTTYYPQFIPLQYLRNKQLVYISNKNIELSLGHSLVR